MNEFRGIFFSFFFLKLTFVIDTLDITGMPPSLNKYRPEDVDEILPWNFLSRSIDSMETLNPRRAIDPSLREGVEDVIREVMEGINMLSKERGRIIDFKELLYGYYRVNPKFGVDYILDLLLSYKKYRGRKMMFPVRRHAYLQQPFGPLVVRKSESESRVDMAAQRIHFIVPLAGRLPIFERFMDNFRRVCIETDDNVRLVIVLFPTMADDDPLDEIRELLAAYRLRFGAWRNFELEVIERKESFARAAALELGASSCHTADDCLLFFIDVDMVFNKEALHRIRKHTIRHRQMYFPIVFSQYDPSFEDDDPESLAFNQIHSSTFDIDDDRGYWRFYGFGIASLYRSDLKQVGGMNLSIHGWGKEDVDLFDRVIRSNLTVFRAADPGLIHVFHPIECDVHLETKQRTMCQGSLANTYASQRRLAQYWIDHHPSS